MIKENKKNKIIIFLCACLMVCASALGLVSSVGTTLASSPTAYYVTTSTFNYKNENFLNQFDFYFSNIGNTVAFATSIGINITLYNMDGTPSSFLITDGAVAGGAWPGSSFIYTLSNNTVLSDNCGSNYNGTQQRLVIGSSSSTPNINFSNLSSLDFLIANLYDTSTGLNYLLCNQRLVDYHNIYFEGKNSIDTSDVYNDGYNAGLQDGYTNGYGEGELEGYENGYNEGLEFGYNQGVNAVLNNPNSYGLYTQAQYQQNYTDGYNAGYNIGYTDGQQSSEAYQNGFNDGKDEVLNNPNNYDLYTEQQYQQNYTDGINHVLNNLSDYNLYTQAQYEQNYTDGYNQGILNSQYGVLSNVIIEGSYEVNDRIGAIHNDDFNFNAGTITPNSSLLNKLNDIFNSDPANPDYAFIEFIFAEQYIYTRDNIINFVNLSLLPNQTSYLSVTYKISLTQSVALIYSFNPIVENNVFTGFNVGIIGDDTPLLNNTIESFVINYLVSDFHGLFLTSDNLVRPQALSIFANNVSFNNGYEVGYIDGTRSDVVNNAYDRGVVDGFNSGYSQGLANQDNATFASMISAVIDVPINAMRNLFNFELLGINLFGFFTALFTLLVVITIVRLILGGK